MLIEPDDGTPHPLGATLSRWYEQGLLELIRLPVAYEEPGSVGALHEAFGAVFDQWDWGTSTRSWSSQASASPTACSRTRG